MKTVRYGVQIRTASGQLITSEDLYTEVPDDAATEDIQKALVQHVHKDMCEAPLGLWQPGKAETTHAGLDGCHPTIINVAHIELLALWVEVMHIPRHATTPVAAVPDGEGGGVFYDDEHRP